MKQKHAFILALLLTLLIASDIYFFSYVKEHARKTVFVEEVIDGDTLVIENDERVRLLNTNAPEKGEKGYEEAKKFLSTLINVTVEMEELPPDKYGRKLARIFTSEYINLEIVKKGLATKFLVDPSELKEFDEAEKQAVKDSLGMWEKSDYSGCFLTEIKAKEEIIHIENICGKMNLKDFTIKDESRKRYKFQDTSSSEVNLHTFEGKDNETDIFWGLGKNVWNNDRDTFYLLDPQGKLAHFHTYGY